MNWTGIILGLFSALVIGMGFVWVIRFEYLVGAYRWKWVAAFGLLVCMSSLFMPNFMLSAVVGIVGGSIVWGAVELPHQEERVDHGLFKAHPARASRPKTNHESDPARSHGIKPGLGKWWSF
ncbi:MAG TPA: DUF4491 family protein [Chloroflexia bacterium]|nr:DUF4491 family protein [Chloroflexia bacterium]